MGNTLRINNLDAFLKQQNFVDTQKDTSGKSISVGTKIKTLLRLDNNEESLGNFLTKLNSLSAEIESLKERVNNVLNSSIDSGNALKVFDSSDGVYKNVKNIVIDEAVKAKEIWDPETQSYIPINLIKINSVKFADRAKLSDQATVATTIMYQGSGQTMENVLVGYASDINIDINNLNERVLKIENNISETGSPNVDLSNYVTNDTLSNYVTNNELSNYATLNDLTDFITLDSLNGYATTGDLFNCAKLSTSNVFTDNNTFNNPVEVGTPTQNNHATTKEYVDNKTSGNSFDEGVEVLTNDTINGKPVYKQYVTTDAQLGALVKSSDYLSASGFVKKSDGSYRGFPWLWSSTENYNVSTTNTIGVLNNGFSTTGHKIMVIYTKA